MKMMLAVSFILVALSSVGAFETNRRVHYDVARCLATETECGQGCCPYSNATCCSETQTCCRADTVCLGHLKLCLGFKTDIKSPSLYTEQSADVINENGCPAGQTSCYGECCPLADAVCCSDEITCCPHNTICDETGSGCLGRVSKRFLNNGSVEASSSSNSILKPAHWGNVVKSLSHTDQNPVALPSSTGWCCYTWYLQRICCDRYCTIFGCF